MRLIVTDECEKKASGAINLRQDLRKRTMPVDGPATDSSPMGKKKKREKKPLMYSEEKIQISERYKTQADSIKVIIFSKECEGNYFLVFDSVAPLLGEESLYIHREQIP